MKNSSSPNQVASCGWLENISGHPVADMKGAMINTIVVVVVIIVYTRVVQHVQCPKKPAVADMKGAMIDTIIVVVVIIVY